MTDKTRKPAAHRKDSAPLPTFHESLRFRIPIAAHFLGQSTSKTWAQIAAGELAVIRDGGNTYVPGSAIAARCRA